MYTLCYDSSRWDDETIYEDFDTVEELMERYNEIEYEVCEIEAWEDDHKIAPWLWKQFKK